MFLIEWTKYKNKDLYFKDSPVLVTSIKDFAVKFSNYKEAMVFAEENKLIKFEIVYQK